MKTYHKIQTVWLRDPEKNFKTLLPYEWAKKEFDELQHIEWVWTEKIDGTNIRVMWDGTSVSFAGKTDNAQIPPLLMTSLESTFTNELMADHFPTATSVCLYGEGYGKKIQKGGNYIADHADFILFDCKILDWWLTRESLEGLAVDLGVKIVPVIGTGALNDAIELVREGFKSTIAQNKDYVAEGLIVKPVVELFNRKGERVVSKIKHKDFR